MAVPTRWMENDEFMSLVKQEQGVVGLYKLTAIPFEPPTPDVPGGFDYHKYPTIRIMLLNVTEPRLYRDENKIVFIVLPAFETVTYEIARDCHPIQDAWMYRFAAYGWDETDSLDSAAYLTDEEPLPKFELADTLTH